MGQNDKIQLFEDKRIRTAWDEEKEEWFFSVVDVIAVLTDSKDPAAYWRKLKQRMREEGNETVTNCHGLKMTAADRCSGCRATSAYHPVHPFSQGGAVQNVAGPSWPGAYRGNHRS